MFLGIRDACALGAAAAAVDIHDGNFIRGSAALRSKFPVLKNQVEIPGRPDLQWSLLEMIVHLNDAERWTRERIADWLDSL